MSSDAHAPTAGRAMDASIEELPLTTGLAHRPATSVPVRPSSQHRHHNHTNYGPLALTSVAASSRMQYRSRPVSVAVDPTSLVISECINITSVIQKYAQSQHLSVSAILGGGAPNAAMQQSFRLGSSEGAGRRAGGRRGGSSSRGGNRPGSAGGSGLDGDFSSANRWGLRGKKGKSMADNPLISGFGRLRQELLGVKGTRGTGVLKLVVERY